MQPYSYQYQGPSGQSGPAIGQIQNAQSMIGGLPQQNPLPSVPQAPQESGWERFLPTIGSIAAPLLGGLLAPETGGLSLLATAGLAGLGSAGGKAVENAVSGQKQDLGGLAGAGAEGAVGGLVGGGANEVLGKVAGKLGGAATDALESKAAAAEAQNLGNEFGAALKPGEQTALKLGNSVDLGKQLGVDTSNPGTAQQMLDLAGNAHTFYNGVKQNVLGEAGPVDMSNVDNVLKDAITQHMGPLGLNAGGGGTPADEVYKTLLPSTGNTLFPDSEGGLNYGAVDPANAYKYVQEVGSHLGSAQDALSSQIKSSLTGTPDADLQGQVNALRQAYGGVKDLVYNRPEVNDILSKITDMNPEEVAARVPGLDPTSPLAAKLAQDANGSTDMQQLLDEQSKFVNMSKAAQKATNFNEQAVATPAAQRTAKAIAGEVGTTPINKGALHAANMLSGPRGILQTISNVLAGGNPGVDQAVATGAGGLATGGAASLPSILAQTASHIPNYASGPQDATITGGNPTVNPYQTTAQSNPNLGELMLQASAFAPNDFGALQGAQKAQAGSQILQGGETAFNNAGGGQGFGGGLLSELSGLIPGTAAYQYNQQKQAIASAIGQATGIDPKAVLAILPSLMSGGQGAANTFGELQGGLNTVAAPGQVTNSVNPSVLSSLPR